MDDFDEIDELFEKATNYVRLNVNNISKENLLYFYARYKQSTEGVCNTERPGFFNFEAKAKYDAWKALNNQSKEDARKEYIELLDKLYPDWRTRQNVKVSSMGDKGTFGFKMSMMAKDDDDTELNDTDKTVFDWCKEGSIENVKMIIESSKNKRELLQQVDDDGMTLLMWACDRGNKDLVNYLLLNGADINAQDGDGQTALHYAVSCEHLDVVKELLENGNIDVNITDSEGLKASDTTSNEIILNILKNKK